MPAVLRLQPDAAVACAEAASVDEGHEKLPAEKTACHMSQISCPSFVTLLMCLHSHHVLLAPMSTQLAQTTE